MEKVIWQIIAIIFMFLFFNEIFGWIHIQKVDEPVILLIISIVARAKADIEEIKERI